MHDVASALMEHDLDEKMLDVPLSLQHGTTKLPLGRFLRRKLRTYIGRDEKQPSGLPATEDDIKLQTLRQIAFNNSTPFKEEILKASEGRRIQIEAKHRRFSKKGSQ